jgi:Na+-driven multidrug efflux pump
MPVFAFANACYFTIRSGGKVLTTIIFDSVFMWTIALPTAFILSRFTSIDIYLLYPLCQSVEFIKILLGAYLLKKGDWSKQIVSKTQAAE